MRDEPKERLRGEASWYQFQISLLKKQKRLLLRLFLATQDSNKKIDRKDCLTFARSESPRDTTTCVT